jgi:PAS domain S-box-containing protein
MPTGTPHGSRPFWPLDAKGVAKGILLPLLVLLGGLGLTWLSWKEAKVEARRELQTYFEFRTRDAQLRIEQRMKTYEQVLRDVHGFVNTARVGRKEFGRLIAGMNLGKNYPGIQGVGFAVVVPRADLARHVAAVRAEGFPNYAIRPTGDRDPYTSIIYLEPFEGRNLRAFGYDMYSEPVRRAALDMARDTADIAISGKVKLVQETDKDIQAGFLMYLPVYALGPGRQEIAQNDASRRGTELRAWVYAPFRMNDLMAGVLGEQGQDLDIEIFDGLQASPENRMFDSLVEAQSDQSPATFQARREIEVGHHLWTMKIRALPAFATRLGPGKAGTILNFGILVSLLLTLLTWSLVRSRDRAVALAGAREQRLKALMQSANNSILLVDPQGRILEANDRATEHFGYSPEELGGMTLDDLNNPEGIPALKRNLGAVWARGSARFETVHRRKGGDSVDSEVSARRVDFGRGRLAFCIIHDVTEQKALREELGQLTRQQRAILDNASIGITFVKDRQQIWCNPGMSEICGYTQEEMADRPTRFLYPSEEAYAQLGREAYPVLWRGEVFRTELALAHKDGSILWASLQGNAIDPHDPSAGSIWTFADISERKRIEDELQLRQTQLEELNRSLEARVGEAVTQLRQKDQMLINQSRQAAMGEMIGNIAHQWRQPLNALSMVIANVRDAFHYGELDKASLEQSLAKGELLIQKMSSTINDFRNFFRPDKAMVSFSALEQVRAALALVDVNFEALGIAITIDAPEDVILFGHPNEYSQVLLNLLTNAKRSILDAKATGGRISIHLAQAQGQGRLTLQDNGGGIPEALLDRIFEPYFSTHESGTGIGLYMSKQIIERNMGGRITARNLPQGAEFALLVPVSGAQS